MHATDLRVYEDMRVWQSCVTSFVRARAFCTCVCVCVCVCAGLACMRLCAWVQFKSHCSTQVSSDTAQNLKQFFAKKKPNCNEIREREFDLFGIIQHENLFFSQQAHLLSIVHHTRGGGKRRIGELMHGAPLRMCRSCNTKRISKK